MTQSQKVGVRSYANTLMIANIYKNIPRRDPVLHRFAKKILNPMVTVVNEDCGTTIGLKINTEEDVIGLIALDTNQPIDEAYLTALYQKGIYDVRVRDTSTCTSRGGVCAKCYRGRLVYKEKYSISGINIEESFGINSTMNSFLKKNVIIQGDEIAYINYVANTFSGALLGVSPIPAGPLPMNSSKWSQITDHKEMDRMCNQLANLKISQDEIDYLYTVKDVLERALIIVAYYGVYGSVNN